MANYLYNGVELPALPEWDKEAYPYAVISYAANMSTPSYFLRAFKEQYKVVEGAATMLNKWDIADGDVLLVCSIPVDGTEWSEIKESTKDADTSVMSHVIKWSNFEVYSTTDELLLAASDPIPVTTAAPIDPTAFMQGWLVGRRIAAMRGKPKEVT